MTEVEIYAALTEIFNEAFFRHDIVLRAEMTARDLPGWDSFRQVEIMIATEDRFGIKLNRREISRLGNVGEFVRMVSTKSTGNHK